MNNGLMRQQLQEIRRYYDSGATQSYAFRKQQLLALKNTLLKYENNIYEALYKDLGKAPEESYGTELGLVLAEINFTLKHLRKWMLPKPVGTDLVNLPSKSKVYRDALGVVLIIGPFNYPLQLIFKPLVGAIAGGNCAVLKPSELTPATADLMEKIVAEIFSQAAQSKSKDVYLARTLCKTIYVVLSYTRTASSKSSNDSQLLNDL